MKYYLEQLLYSLNEPELELLQPISTGSTKISSYLSVLIENRKQGILDKEFIKKKFNIDEGALRKMRSVLFSKCLASLSPEGGMKLLNFLSTHRLREIFIRESESLIRQTKKRKISKREKAEIYLECIMGYLRLPYSLFEEKKVNEYLNEFLSVYDKQDKSVLAGIIKLNKIFILIVKSYYRFEIVENNYIRFYEEIKSVEKETVRFNTPRLIALTEALYLVLDFYYKANYEELQNRFEKVVKAYSSFSGSHTIDEYLAVSFYRAYNQLMIGNLRKSNNLFKQMETEMQNAFSSYPNINYRYVISLLLTDRNEAKRVLERYLNKSIIAFDNDSIVLSSVGNAMYYLLENNPDKAITYINQFWEITDRKEFFLFEYTIRIIEIICFYQRGDDEFAITQMKRFRQFIRGKSKRMGILSISIQINNLVLIFEKFINKEIQLAEFEKELTTLLQKKNNIIIELFINAARIRERKLI